MKETSPKKEEDVDLAKGFFLSVGSDITFWFLAAIVAGLVMLVIEFGVLGAVVVLVGAIVMWPAVQDALSAGSTTESTKSPEVDK
jgi:hypothetical protein